VKQTDLFERLKNGTIAVIITFIIVAAAINATIEVLAALKHDGPDIIRCRLTSCK